MDFEALLSGRLRSIGRAARSDSKADRATAVSAILGRDVRSQGPPVDSLSPSTSELGNADNSTSRHRPTDPGSAATTASQPPMLNLAQFTSSRELVAALQRDLHSLAGSATTGAAWSSSLTDRSKSEAGVPLPQRRAALARVGRVLIGWDITELNCFDSTTRALPPPRKAASHPLSLLFSWLLLPADFEIDGVPSGVSLLVEECARVMPFRAHQLSVQRRAVAATGDGAGSDDDDDGEAFTRGGAGGTVPSADERLPSLPGIFEDGEEESGGEESEKQGGDDGAPVVRRKPADRRSQHERWRCLYLLAAIGGVLVPSLLLRACDPASETVRYGAVRLVSGDLWLLLLLLLLREGPEASDPVAAGGVEAAAAGRTTQTHRPIFARGCPAQTVSKGVFPK